MVKVKILILCWWFESFYLRCGLGQCSLSNKAYFKTQNDVIFQQIKTQVLRPTKADKASRVLTFKVKFVGPKPQPFDKNFDRLAINLIACSFQPTDAKILKLRNLVDWFESFCVAAKFFCK